MSADPIVDTMNTPSTPAPADSSTPVADSGAVAVTPTDNPVPVAATPAPPPEVSAGDVPDFGPEPTVPGADPASQQIQMLQRQIEMLASQIKQPGQTVQQAASKANLEDDLLDDTPQWAKDIKGEILSLKQQQEAVRKAEESMSRESHVRQELAGAKSILDGAAQQHQFTKDNPEMGALIADLLGERVHDLVTRNPYQHGLTPEHVQAAYAKMAQRFHQTLVKMMGKRQQTAAAQVAANAQTSAVLGGTTPAPSSQKRSGGDLLTDEGFWNNEVNAKLASAVSRLTGQ